MKEGWLLRILNECRAPIVLLFAFALLIIGEHNGLVPSFIVMVGWLRAWLDKYGLWVVGPASFLENCTIVNFVFPGAIVILTAMALTIGDLNKAFATFLLIWIGSLIGLIVSYIIGRAVPRATQDDSVNDALTTRKTYFDCLVTFWHPQLASMTCYSFGVNKTSIANIIVPIVFINLGWNIFWAVTVYNFGVFFDSAESIKTLILISLVVWIMAKSAMFIRRETVGNPQKN